MARLDLKRIVVVVAVACTVLVAAMQLHWRPGCVRMEGLAWLPEPEVVDVIKQRQLRGRLLTWFGWGEYAIWHFSPDLKVSFDGRRETVYSDPFAAAHIALYWTPEQQRGFLEKLNADYAWLPRTLPLALMLQREGWTIVFAGPQSVVLSRRPLTASSGQPVDAVRCFPGP